MYNNKTELQLISVIVPIYKVEKYLNNCVESIQNQTYKNLEIILVDDGSPDSCPELCDKFAEEDERIKVVHKVNGGLSDARNAGIEVATGTYITFVDSDDFLLEDMIETLYYLSEEYDADFVMCGKMDCGDDDIIGTIVPKSGPSKIKVFEGREKMTAYLKTNQIETTAWKKLYKSYLLDEIRFPKGKLHEDAFTTYKLVDAAGKILVTNKVGYVYRNNPQSIMNSGFSLKRLHSVEAKEEQLSYIEEKYPELRKFACAEVIYACNFCLKEMAKKDFLEKDIEKMLQVLYRKYYRQYLTVNNVSIRGKMLALAATINTRFARKILKFTD